MTKRIVMDSRLPACAEATADRRGNDNIIIQSLEYLKYESNFTVLIGGINV